MPTIQLPKTGMEGAAKFLGWQETFAGQPPLELWNLTRQVGIHPAGSTLVRSTILNLLAAECSELRTELRTEGRAMRPFRINIHA